jgi:sugar transferase (PEP-CTERM/EpsH1 system associated)
MLQVYNGVDADRFQPARLKEPVPGCPFSPSEDWIVGTVGRMQRVKDQPTLTRAFIRALEIDPTLKARLRLTMVGDGSLRRECQQLLTDAGLHNLAWLPGERSDIPEIMHSFDCFVLPSLAEGISNTILEAMASGLPVIATAVGGNTDLVSTGVSGEIVPPANVDAMAQQICRLASHPDLARRMGRAGREGVEQKFSMNAMVAAYQSTYDRLLLGCGISTGKTVENS